MRISVKVTVIKVLFYKRVGQPMSDDFLIDMLAAPARDHVTQRLSFHEFQSQNTVAGIIPVNLGAVNIGIVLKKVGENFTVGSLLAVIELVDGPALEFF